MVEKSNDADRLRMWSVNLYSQVPTPIDKDNAEGQNNIGYYRSASLMKPSATILAMDSTLLCDCGWGLPPGVRFLSAVATAGHLTSSAYNAHIKARFLFIHFTAYSGTKKLATGNESSWLRPQETDGSPQFALIVDITPQSSPFCPATWNALARRAMLLSLTRYFNDSDADVPDQSATGGQAVPMQAAPQMPPQSFHQGAYQNHHYVDPNYRVIGGGYYYPQTGQGLSLPASGGRATHQIINLSDQRMGFKVKSSNNNHYRVEPVYGFVAPQGKTPIEIIRLAGPPKEDKLVVQWVEVAAEEEDPQAPFKAGAHAGEAILPIKSE